MKLRRAIVSLSVVVVVASLGLVLDARSRIKSLETAIGDHQKASVSPGDLTTGFADLTVNFDKVSAQLAEARRLLGVDQQSSDRWPPPELPLPAKLTELSKRLTQDRIAAAQMFSSILAQVDKRMESGGSPFAFAAQPFEDAAQSGKELAALTSRQDAKSDVSSNENVWTRLAQTLARDAKKAQGGRAAVDAIGKPVLEAMNAAIQEAQRSLNAQTSVDATATNADRLIHNYLAAESASLKEASCVVLAVADDVPTKDNLPLGARTFTKRAAVAAVGAAWLAALLDSEVSAFEADTNAKLGALFRPDIPLSVAPSPEKDWEAMGGFWDGPGSGPPLYIDSRNWLRVWDGSSWILVLRFNPDYVKRRDGKLIHPTKLAARWLTDSGMNAAVLMFDLSDDEYVVAQVNTPGQPANAHWTSLEKGALTSTAKGQPLEQRFQKHTLEGH